MYLSILNETALTYLSVGYKSSNPFLSFHCRYIAVWNAYSRSRALYQIWWGWGTEFSEFSLRKKFPELFCVWEFSDPQCEREYWRGERKECVAEREELSCRRCEQEQNSMPSRKRMNVPILRPISHLQDQSGRENSVTQGNRIVETSVLGRNSSPCRGTTAAQ